MMMSKYQHLYVVIEHEDGVPLPVSLEMLGEARRLMDGFNRKYSSDEKVVAVVLGHNVRKLCEELIFYGADAVIYADSPQLRYRRNLIDTKVISQIARSREVAAKFSDTLEFVKPRYMFFGADSIGRHLSSTVLAELESGLASDINKLVIEDLEIKHEHKTKGQAIKYEKTLEMYRPDFSGFLWTTILCLDNRNPSIEREYHPQGCSIIPGVFVPIEPDKSRRGQIVDYVPEFDERDLQVRILDRKIVKSAVDFDSHKAVISFGKGVKDSPEQNIKLLAQLAKEIEAEVGISLPISKKPFPVSDGISGAMQHIAGMKESGFIVAINPDENSPIKDECDMFIRGRMEDVIPLLLEELRKQRPTIEVKK
jgi:electron transfer flavoprotein alpha subunit